MNIMIVDDVKLICLGLKALLEDMGHTVVAEASSATEAIKQLSNNTPDLLILDYELGNYTAMDICGSLSRQGRAIPTLILTSIKDVHLQRKLVMESTVQGVLQKGNQHCLEQAIKSVTNGKLYLDPDVMADVVLYHRLLNGLATKQADVVYWMSKGLSNDHISEKLDLGVRTISNYRSQIRNLIKNDSLKKIRELISGVSVSSSCS